MKKLLGIGMVLVAYFSGYAAEDRFKIRNEEPMQDNKYTLGDLDKLMIKKLVAEKGLAGLKREIATHVFNNSKMLETMPPFRISQPNPYIIEHLVKKDDQSEISEEAFDRIFCTCTQQVAEIFHGNQLNKEYELNMYSGPNSNLHQDRFDYCTYINTPDKSYLGKAHTVEVKTVLYDKQSILDFLNTLKQ